MELQEVDAIPALENPAMKPMSETTKELLEAVNTMIPGKVYKITPKPEDFKKTRYSLLTVQKKFPLTVSKRGDSLYLVLSV